MLSTSAYLRSPSAPRLDRSRPLQSILVAASGVTAIALLSKILGFAEKVVVAHFLGTSTASDCYYLATSVMWSVVFLFLEILQPSCLPVYSQIIASQQARECRRFLIMVGTAVGLCIVIAGLALATWPQVVARLIAPGLSTGPQTDLSQLLRHISAGTMLLAMVMFTKTLLNAHGCFWWAAIGDTVFRFIFVGGITAIFLLGLPGWIGAVLAAAAAAPLLLHILILRRRATLFVHQARSTHEASPLQQVIVLASPLLVGVLLSHLSQLVDGMLASTLPAGRISAITYAKRIIDTIVLLGPVTLTTILFTRFSTLANAGDLDKLSRTLSRAIRLILLFGLPVSVLVIALSKPIVAILFGHGRFDPASVEVTSSALSYYGFAVIALSLDGLLASAFYALKDTKTPVAIGLCTTAVDIGLAWFLMPHLDLCGIALSLSITRSAKVAILATVLHRRLGLSLLSCLQPIYTLSIATGLMSIVVHQTRGLWAKSHVSGTLSTLLCLAIPMSAGMVVFFLVVWALGVVNAKEVLASAGSCRHGSGTSEWADTEPPQASKEALSNTTNKWQRYDR